MTITTTEAALLRAIAAHPDEDTPRLMYADWLDENAGECPQCDGTGWERVADSAGDMDDQPCRKCGGAGVDFRRERAEFIRLQIWISQQQHRHDVCPGCGYEPADGYHHNSPDCPYVRVSELWHGGVREQFACAGIQRIMGPGGGYSRDMPTLLVDRGFAETLYLPTLADLCERERVTCSACDGKGYFFTKDHGIFSRQGHNICADCRTCHGTRDTIGDYTGKPTKLALDTMRAHPTITRVVVGDQRPTRGTARIPGRGQFFHYYRITDDTPRFIVERLGENQFTDADHALDALAVAAGQWLRKEATT